MPVQYPAVRALARAFAPAWHLEKWQGIGVVVPPSYLEPVARQFPRVLNAWARIDPWLGRTPVLRGMADHILLTCKRVCSR